MASELRQLGGIDIVNGGRAAVTLVVLEPSAVIGRTEIELVRIAATESTEVVCALTGIDRVPGRRAIRDADIEILHRHAPWLMRVVVLSLSADAARRAREPLGRDEAGIADLRDVLIAAVRATHDPRRARSAVVAATRLMIDEEIEETEETVLS